MSTEHMPYALTVTSLKGELPPSSWIQEPREKRTMKIQVASSKKVTSVLISECWV